MVLLPFLEPLKYVRKEKFSHLEVGGELCFKPLSREQLNPSILEELIPAVF